MKKNGIEFKVGTKFRGNVNGFEFEVIEINKCYAKVEVTKGSKYHIGKRFNEPITTLEYLNATEI